MSQYLEDYIDYQVHIFKIYWNFYVLIDSAALPMSESDFMNVLSILKSTSKYL